MDKPRYTRGAQMFTVGVLAIGIAAFFLLLLWLVQ
jgi:hypothetical protein